MSDFTRAELIELCRRTRQEAETGRPSPAWRLAYWSLYKAADHLDAMVARSTESEEADYETEPIKQQDTRMLIEILSAASRISVTLSTKRRLLPPWPAPTLDGAIRSLTGHELWRVDPVGDGKFQRIYGESRDPEARREMEAE